MYGPNIGADTISCKARISVPTKPISLPEDCLTPLTVTSAVIAILFAKSPGVKITSGGGGDTDGGGSRTSGDGGGRLEMAAVPDSMNGDMTFPAFPLMVKVSVSARVGVPLPVEKLKRTISPSSLAYMIIWKSALPLYGPNGGVDGVSCRPRTCAPTKAVSVPVAWMAPLNVTSAEADIVLAKSPGLNAGCNGADRGGGDGKAGGSNGSGGGGCGGGERSGEGGGASDIRKTGSIALPAFPLMSNTNVSDSANNPLPASNWKLIVSPPDAPFEYSTIWKIDWPMYGPNGGVLGVDCWPRTAVPTNANSVPDD